MRLVTHILVIVVVIIVTVIITVILVRRSGACRGTSSGVSEGSWLNRLLGKANRGEEERDDGFLSRLGKLVRETGKRYEGSRVRIRDTIRSPTRERSGKRYRDTELGVGRGEDTPREDAPREDARKRESKRKRGDIRGRQKKLAYEKRCRQILEQVFDDEFPKIRPAWLRNERRDARTGTGTGHCLELDCYNERLRVALEYNGAQHRVYPNTWHSSRQEFEDQRKRDRLKVVRCDEEEIKLIVVPDTVPYNELYTYITEELERRGIIEFSD